MSSRIFNIPDTLDWKQAYMAAVLEKDHSRIAPLIHHAREKLASRLRELTAIAPHKSEETEAIHDALYRLQALQSSLAYRDESVRSFGDSDRVA